MIEGHLVGFESVGNYGGKAYDRMIEKRQAPKMSREKCKENKERFRKIMRIAAANELKRLREAQGK